MIPAVYIPRLISEHSISGWGSPAQNYVNDLVVNFGWKFYAETIMRPIYDMGCRRFILRCPFGVQSGPNGLVLNFDAVDKATPESLKDFTEAMLPFTESGEVIVYIGCPNVRGPNRISKFQRNVQRAIDTGCALAYDAIVDEPKGGSAWEMFEWAMDQGVRCYTEGWPAKQRPWWMPFPSIAPWPQYELWNKPQEHEFSVKDDPAFAKVWAEHERIVWLDVHPDRYKWSFIEAQLKRGGTYIAGLYTALVEKA